MINVQNAITKKEYNVIYKFLEKLIYWYDTEQHRYDRLTTIYYDRLIVSIMKLISFYRENEYIDIEYCLQLIRHNMYNLMEEYRTQKDNKYKSFKDIYDLLYDIKKR